MANKGDGRVVLYLAYSADVGSGRPNHLAHGPLGIQLELFPIGNPDAVIFTSPRRTDLAQILRMIERFTVKNILDLRDLPALNFDRVSRTHFLDALLKCRVEYRPFPVVLGTDFQADTISEFFHFIHENSRPNWVSVMKKCVEPLIQGGPTIVFTEGAPEVDEVAREFAETLVRSKISFRQVFASPH